MSEMTKRVDAVGAETSSHIDGDAEITTYTFNEAQSPQSNSRSSQRVYK
jgi:hypothetical protein